MNGRDLREEQRNKLSPEEYQVWLRSYWSERNTFRWLCIICSVIWMGLAPTAQSSWVFSGASLAGASLAMAAFSILMVKTSQQEVHDSILFDFVSGIFFLAAMFLLVMFTGGEGNSPSNVISAVTVSALLCLPYIIALVIALYIIVQKIYDIDPFLSEKYHQIKQSLINYFESGDGVEKRKRDHEQRLLPENDGELVDFPQLASQPAEAEAAIKRLQAPASAPSVSTEPAPGYVGEIFAEPPGLRHV